MSVMRSSARTGKWTIVAAGLGALVVTTACGGGTSAIAPAAAPGGTQAQVVVGCEPHQRTLVRPVIVNGAAMSQIECVAAEPAVQQAAPVNPAPAVTAPAPAPRVVQAQAAAPAYSDLPDARVVPVADAPVQTVRTVRTRQVIEDERPYKKPRSVKKSAIVIGASAGAGAGLGAAIGGKKGALIGAAIGGGGAAVWDQVTRKR